ncbi:MAG TPA: serine hydrolase domain-containing protein, partial [Allosphingosinicella sp.]|nr:serine hydrolase domain-containing protein [Allosphingosinicella sp.]
KTFASVMLGGLMRRGTAIGPDSRIYAMLERQGPFANPHPDKAAITLTHLMTHSSGLACNDNDEESPGNEDRMQSQTAQGDWWRYTLDLPRAHPPGTRYAYCSGNMNLVGAALTQASGTWLPELFDQLVAEPLQFRGWHWNLMPTGEGYLGGGAYVLPRDLIKLGQTFLDGGVWNSRRIVDAEWVARSTAQAIEITPATTGLDGEAFGNSYGPGGADGLAWHLGTVPAGGRTYRAYNASGNGGQILVVVPELELVVVFTAENYGQGWIWGRWGDELVGGMIVPAIRGRAAGTD